VVLGGAQALRGIAAPLLAEQSSQLEPSGVPENPFRSAAEEGLTTFSIDADGGSYSLTRAQVGSGSLPSPESIRVEEFLNYFHFHYAQPQGDEPLALYTELGDCPWNPAHRLLLVGMQGQELDFADSPPANLVYLIDVSGSMTEPNKLPLLKRGFRLLTQLLRPQDTVSMVTYAGVESVVLQGAHGDDKDAILAAIDGLQSGGSTNGAGGIQKAYELASQYFIDGGTNRVLLATDGDFNVGLSSTDELVQLIATERASGVQLSVYGFGSAWDGGNYRDEMCEQLADNGDGFYFYIDGDEEARRAFSYTVSSSLLTVAKDVKVQAAFNPSLVRGYRLIGYENRLLSNSDFSNDSVDAGELGASMSVTALFELIPADSNEALPTPLPGTIPEVATAADGSAAATTDAVDTQSYPALGEGDVAQLRIRYKASGSDTSTLRTLNLEGSIARQPSPKFAFAAGVAEFALWLRGSQYLPLVRDEALRQQFETALPLDGEGAIQEAIALLGSAHALPGR